MGKKICMLVTNPVTNDPRVRREARTLSEADFKVVVIGVWNDETMNAEWIDGCKIIRIPHPIAWFKGLLKRLGLYQSARRLYRWLHQGAGNTSLEDGSAGARGNRTPPPRAWLRKLRGDVFTIVAMMWLNVALAKQAQKQGADIYHAHDLDTLLAGYLAKRRTRKPLVYDYHELYTEQFERGQKTRLWRVWYATLERFLVKRADLKLTVCDSLGGWIAQRYGVSKSITIMNAPPYQQPPSIRTTSKKETVILYQGLYFRYRGLEQLIESARYLDGGRIVLRGYGDWEDHLRSLVQQWKLEDRVAFSPPVQMTELVRVASEADIGVAPFIPVCLNTHFCLPNKLFEYMMAGLAIVGSDLPEMRRIIVDHQLGAVFNPKDPAEIARTINALVNDSARLQEAKHNARVWARTHYNWDVEGPKLVSLYQSTFDELVHSGNGNRQSDCHAD